MKKYSVRVKLLNHVLIEHEAKDFRTLHNANASFINIVVDDEDVISYVLNNIISYHVKENKDAV